MIMMDSLREGREEIQAPPANTLSHLSRVRPQCMSEISEYHDHGDLPRLPHKEVFAQAEQPIGWQSE